MPVVEPDPLTPLPWRIHSVEDSSYANHQAGGVEIVAANGELVTWSDGEIACVSRRNGEFICALVNALLEKPDAARR